MKQFRIEATIDGATLTVSKEAKHAPLKLARKIRDIGAERVSVLVFSERSQIWFGVCEVKP